MTEDEITPIIDGIITLMDMSLTKLWEIVKDCVPQSIESQRICGGHLRPLPGGDNFRQG